MSRYAKPQNQNCEVVKSTTKQPLKSADKNSFELEEEDSDQAVNFTKSGEEEEEAAAKSASYQETDLDQPVNFSIRYAENVTDSEDDRSSPFERRQILMEEDCVRTYFTEGTPKVTSNSGSVTDLRVTGAAKEKPSGSSQAKPLKSVQSKQGSSDGKPKKNITPVTNSGLLTPEKPVNYCEEGTPGDFSRCDSLSDLGEPQSPALQVEQKDPVSVPPEKQEQSTAATPKTVKFSKCADGTPLETPLMYSRHSSAESLASAGSVCGGDDKSSVVSDFR